MAWAGSGAVIVETVVFQGVGRLGGRGGWSVRGVAALAWRVVISLRGGLVIIAAVGDGAGVIGPAVGRDIVIRRASAVIRRSGSDIERLIAVGQHPAQLENLVAGQVQAVVGVVILDGLALDVV